MKFKKFFPTLICAALIAGVGGVALATQVARGERADKVNALTDLGAFTFDDANGDSAVNYMYGINWTVNEAPDGWGTEAFAPVDANSGTFIDGVRVGTEIKKIGANTYYIAITGADVDSVVTVKGSWANSTYQFSVNEFVRKWNGTNWVYALEDYDLISLKDANLPDFNKTAINTEDAEGYGYIGYDDSGYAKKYIGKRKGIFGLTNDADSYAFQYNFELDKDQKLTDWVTIRIGASGGWNTGNLLLFRFTNIWHDDGVAQIVEYRNGVAQSADNAHEFRTDISDGQRLIEMGAIKVKGYENKYYVFFKNNGVVSFGEYWDLVGQRSTKVGIYSANPVSISNSLQPAETKLTLSIDSSASGLYFNTAVDVLPFISSWSLWFTPVEANSVKYNDVDFSSETWNFFKKVGATTNSFYLNIADLHKVASYAPAVDDTLHIGGMFKMATYIDEVTVVYKVYIEDIDLQFDGTAWRVFDPNYSAVDFAKDLLKQTLTICTGAGGDNGEALAAVWATLAGSNYYGKLSNSERNDLATEAGDKDIVVPTSAAGVDAMDDADAIAAGLYRYDYCTVKYSLSEFITGRTINLASAEMRVINTTTNVNVVLLITISAIVVGASLFVVLHFVSRKRKQDR